MDQALQASLCFTQHDAFRVNHFPLPYRLRCRRCRRRRRPRPPPQRQSAISPALRSTRLCESGRHPPWPCPWRCPRARQRTGPPSAGRSFPWLNEEEERDGERKRRRRRSSFDLIPILISSLDPLFLFSSPLFFPLFFPRKLPLLPSHHSLRRRSRGRVQRPRRRRGGLHRFLFDQWLRPRRTAAPLVSSHCRCRRRFHQGSFALGGSRHGPGRGLHRREARNSEICSGEGFARFTPSHRSRRGVLLQRRPGKPARVGGRAL